MTSKCQTESLIYRLDQERRNAIHIAKWINEILGFTHIIIFLFKQSEKYNKISKITDIFAVTDTISICRKTDI